MKSEIGRNCYRLAYYVNICKESHRLRAQGRQTKQGFSLQSRHTFFRLSCYTAPSHLKVRTLQLVVPIESRDSAACPYLQVSLVYL